MVYKACGEAKSQGDDSRRSYGFAVTQGDEWSEIAGLVAKPKVKATETPELRPCGPIEKSPFLDAAADFFFSPSEGEGEKKKSGRTAQAVLS